jgi:hypothetical protein
MSRSTEGAFLIQLAQGMLKTVAILDGDGDRRIKAAVLLRSLAFCFSLGPFVFPSLPASFSCKFFSCSWLVFFITF